MEDDAASENKNNALADAALLECLFVRLEWSRSSRDKRGRL